MFFAMLKPAVFSAALRAACTVAACCVALPASAFEESHRQLDVVVFNYLDRQIWDVTVSGVRVGSAGRFPYSGRRTKVGARVNDGPQKVTWRLPGLDGGEATLVTARNAPNVAGRTRDSRFMAVHVYPDYSVELKFSEEPPVYSARGQAISNQYDRNKGQ